MNAGHHKRVVQEIESLKNRTVESPRIRGTVSASKGVQKSRNGSVASRFDSVWQLHRPLHASQCANVVSPDDSCGLLNRIMNFFGIEPPDILSRVIRDV